MGPSDPKSTFLPNIELLDLPSISGKYFGAYPDKSIKTLGFCRATAKASSCQGNEKCVRIIFISGESTATSSVYIGLEYFSRIFIPPGSPDSIPVCLVWKRATPPFFAITL